MQYQSDYSIFIMNSSPIASFLIRLLTAFPAEVYSVAEYGGHEEPKSIIFTEALGVGTAVLVLI